MTQDLDSGRKDVKPIVKEPATPFSKAGQEIAMLLALQKKEWHELRSVPGVTLKYLNMTMANNRKILLVAIGSEKDDISGIDATLDISINGIGIDAIVEKVASNN